MKKSLALAVMVLVAASGFAQKEKPAFVNKDAVKKDAAQVKVGAITAPSTTTAGTLALFNDTTGDLGASSLFQVLSGTNAGNIGIGTKSPLGTLTLLGDNPTMRIENYSGSDFGSPNFNFASANGTSASPTGTMNGDNLGQFAASGYIPGVGFSSGTKVKVNFVAAENWSTTGNGTEMYFSTTPAGSTVRGVQLIIDGNGNVGIGNSNNANPTTTDKLYVKGNIHSSTGYVFPDGTTQTTAFTAGGTGFTSPNGTINIGNKSGAVTVDVNTTAVQARVTGTCPSGQAVTGVNANGSVTCAAAGGTSSSTPTVVAQTTVTGSAGSGSSQTIYTTTAAGWYRVSIYMNNAAGGTCSSPGTCTGETLTLQWNDGLSTTAQATAVCSLVAPCASTYTVPLYLPSGQAISAYGQSYGSGANTPTGTYTAYILVEQL